MKKKSITYKKNNKNKRSKSRKNYIRGGGIFSFLNFFKNNEQPINPEKKENIQNEIEVENKNVQNPIVDQEKENEQIKPLEEENANKKEEEEKKIPPIGGKKVKKTKKKSKC